MPRKILVVDDEEAVLSVALKLLKSGGYAATGVLTGNKAIELLNKEHFDLLLADYHLADIDGIEVIKAAKEIHPDIASILFTGVGNQETIITAFTEGKIDYYLTKPFTMGELLRIVSLAIKDADVRIKEKLFTMELEQKITEATVELEEKNRLLEAREAELKELNLKLTEEHKILQTLNEKLEKLSITDEMTGLYNHRKFMERLCEEVERVKRTKHPVSLIMIDIDDFKKLNDKYGHLAGDAVLGSLAKILIKTSRKVDMAARYGGEEFAIILPDENSEGAGKHAERLRREVECSTVRWLGQNLSITISLGVSCFDPELMKEPNDLILSADKALYEAKRSGKNRVVTAAPACI